MQDTNGKENIEISVVIPCLNEEETLGNVLEKVLLVLSKMGVASEVIISDNSSTDGSIEIAEKYKVKVVNVLQRGYGKALNAGIHEAQGKYIIFGDADGSYDFSYIPDFFTLLKKGNDMVIGSRMRGNMEKNAMPFLHKYIGTPILTFLINSIYGLRITDCNSGMRGLRQSVYKDLDLHSSGMEYISEMTIKASFLNLAIYEFPMNFFRDKRSKPPHLRTWRDGIRNLKIIFYYIPKRLSFLLQKRI